MNRLDELYKEAAKNDTRLIKERIRTPYSLNSPILLLVGLREDSGGNVWGYSKNMKGCKNLVTNENLDTIIWKMEEFMLNNQSSCTRSGEENNYLKQESLTTIY